MKQPAKPFALCLENTDYEASLVRGKIYRLLPDARAAKDAFIRIVDESGEDYLYHKEPFCLCGFSKHGEEENPSTGEHQLNHPVHHTHAAETLGLSRQGLLKKMERYGFS